VYPPFGKGPHQTIANPGCLVRGDTAEEEEASEQERPTRDTDGLALATDDTPSPRSFSQKRQL
jgi:hypothetical protein